jgi:ABC-2 type transport system permease protein
MNPRATATAFRYAVAAGLADYATIYTWRTWCIAWLSRVVCQVAFFALIGRLLHSADQVRFLLVGNAVAMAALESFFVCASTVWERHTGTLPLLIASPTSIMVAFGGRSVFWMGSGIMTASISLFGLAPLFGVRLPATAPFAIPLIAAVAVGSYCCALALAGLVLRAMELRNLAGNVGFLVLTIVCGVQVRLDYWPGWVQALAEVLPVRHGLMAVRILLDGGQPGVIAREGALELAVGAGWLVVAAASFARLTEHGRRSGSIEFGA